MASVRAKVVGLETVRAAVAELVRVSPYAGLRAVQKALIDIQRDAKENQTAHVDTGRLRASISINWTGSGIEKGKVEPTKNGSPNDGVGNPGGQKDNPTGVVGTNVEYAPHHEATYPFLTPAFESNKRKLLSYVREELTRVLSGV